MQKTMNIHGTEAGSLTVVLPEVRRNLWRQRIKFGAGSPIGRRISNLIEQLKHLPNATNNRASLREKILQQVDGIEQRLK